LIVYILQEIWSYQDLNYLANFFIPFFFSLNFNSLDFKVIQLIFSSKVDTIQRLAYFFQVVFFMLACRLIIVTQVRRQDRLAKLKKNWHTE
jgi:hypothetical protein